MPTSRPLLAAAATLLMLLGGCARERLERFEFTRLCMGVPARVVLYAPDAPTAESAAAAAYDRLNELDRVMSDYQQDSELMRLCRGPVGVPQPVSADLLHAMSVAEEIGAASGGAFDVTVGPVVRVWREARRSGRLPERSAVDAAMQSVGWRHIHIDRAGASVTLLRHGMLLDLGGIGKGYAASEAVEVLKARGVPRCLVALSGDIAAGDGPPGNRRWIIAGALRPNGGLHGVRLENAAISTAGDDEQFLEVEGVRHSHIVDPRTGRAMTTRQGATVIAPRGEIADGVDSALCVLDADAGRALVREFPGVGACVWARGGGEPELLLSERPDLFLPVLKGEADMEAFGELIGAHRGPRK